MALRHGALVRATWDVPVDEPCSLVRYNVLLEWDGRVGMNSPESDLMLLGNEIAHALASHEGATVGIDWDGSIPHWGGRKAQVKLAFLMGYVVRGCVANGVIPVFISPQSVRVALGLSKNLQKERVWQSAGLPADKADSDVKDALLLSYIVLNGENRHRAGSTAQADLSGFRVARENPKDPSTSSQTPRRVRNSPVHRPEWSGRRSHTTGHAGESAAATPPTG